MRVAEAGAWLGGIVPYGYRKVGEKRDARIAVFEDPIPGVGMSEPDVIREVFRMAAVERKSCRVIAERLNQLRIPCAYVRDDRLTLRGKRKQKTSGMWRPGRIRGLLTNKTYFGLHEFGKRSRGGRPVVTRPVPAIVTEDDWKKAQKTLASNFLFGARNARNRYLLRGLIKCKVCGLTYIGLPANSSNGRGESYYKCNGVHNRSLFGNLGRKCPSKAVRGDHLEKLVWSDVEGFLRNPGAVLQQLRAKLEGDQKGTDKHKQRQHRLEGLLAEKATERTRVVSLYRRGRLNDADLDQQMSDIGREEAALQAQLDELTKQGAGRQGNRCESDVRRDVALEITGAAGRTGFLGMQAPVDRGAGGGHRGRVHRRARCHPAQGHDYLYASTSPGQIERLRPQEEYCVARSGASREA